MAALGSAPFAVDALTHNHRLNRLEERFLAVKHPASSELVERYSELGRYRRLAGEDCTYFVGELRATKKDPAQAAASYAGLSIESVGLDGKGKPRACALKAEAVAAGVAARGESLPGFYHPAFWRRLEEKIGQRKDLFLVYCADAGQPAGLDFRCR